MNHLLTLLTKHALLDSQEVMPHIKSISVAAHALKEGTKELDDLLKEWMVTVAFSVGNLRLEYFV